MTHPLMAKMEGARQWRDHLRERCRRGRRPHRPIVLLSQIIVATCEYFGLTPEGLMAKDRTGEVVRARQIAMFLTRRLSDRSLPDVAREFGGRDHTTVLHSVRKIERAYKADAEVRADVDAIAGAVLHGW